MKNKKTFCFIVTFYLLFSCQAQEKNDINTIKKINFWKKVSYGGGIGLDLTSDVFSINLSPSAIYRVNNSFSTGAGVNFGYSNFNLNDAKQFNYGLSLINLYNPIDSLQLSAELEYVFVNQSFEILDETIRTNFNFPVLNIGAGYRVGNFAAGIRYDILYDENKSISSSALTPFARFYFN